ncbi:MULTISPECIES: hypothetical protein [unclassified Paraburkholderia]|uniref:hypothetical protein n=1 Tax=unclassified Paraburkholderia TaxID=2615204 RepID=UPI002AB109FC|nr:MULTISPECIES: hypothetical protein [unclassified Paraburkholderia]
MKLVNETISSVQRNRATKTRIDAHPLAANLGAFIGLLPLVGYWISFKAFKSSTLPWKIALASEFICPTIIYVQYILNRRARRLFCEGIAAIAGLVPTWLAIGSYWLFYLGFAPMPFAPRVIALSICLAITLIVIIVVLQNYRRATTRLNLVQRMDIMEPDTIVYPDTLDAGIPMFERSLSRLPTPPLWLFSTVGSIGTAYAMVSGRVFETSGGPHILFIMLSVVSFPVSCAYIGHFFVRLGYFHIYLPLKLERDTGKKVILGPWT